MFLAEARSATSDAKPPWAKCGICGIAVHLRQAWRIFGSCEEGVYTYCCILNPLVNSALLALSDMTNILNSPENQHPKTMSTSSRAGQWPCWLHLSFGFVAASQIQPLLWLGPFPPDRLKPSRASCLKA